MEHPHVDDLTGAVVVLSGGQDSTTCLYWAINEWGKENVNALTFYYGQRHAIEIESAITTAKLAEVAHEVVELGPVLAGTSPLVNHDVAVQHYKTAADMPGGVEPTFVPGRNMLFLSIAANRAAVHRRRDIVIGVSQEDYGGYPDCRLDFLKSMRETIEHALGFRGIKITAPLLHKTKKQTVELAATLPGCLEALAFSHTCYDGEYPPNPSNHASILRARGFKEAGIPDPLIVRAKREGLLPSDYPEHGLIEA